ncbi:MAG: hypothetical protein ACR2N3_07065 [Pyrinomonadaceae bacterium]
MSFENFAQTLNVTANAERISGDKFDFSAQTSKGARVYSYQKINPATLKAIDTGLDNLFAVARKHNYYSHLDYSDYTIYIARPDRLKNADGNYSPGIAIAPAQYAGSVYDKGGYIFVAGMVISDNPSAFLIVDYNDQNLSGVSDIVRYEGEHLILYFNDRQLYNQTADHSKGGGHPILQ